MCPSTELLSPRVGAGEGARPSQAQNEGRFCGL